MPSGGGAHILGPTPPWTPHHSRERQRSSPRFTEEAKCLCW